MSRAKIFSKRSKFNLSHNKTLTCQMGKLIPVYVQEVLPGDTIKHSLEAIVRFSPLLAPIMHEVRVDTQTFFVPYRLLHDNWQSFITGGEKGTDNTTPPYIVSPLTTGFAVGSLADYLGIPTGDDNHSFSAFAFRAYNLIYNEWYRDQWLQDPVPNSKADGLDTTSNVDLLNRNWEKDYFTSCLPEPQKGEEVYLPLGETAPVVRNDSATGWDVYQSGNNIKVPAGATIDINNGTAGAMHSYLNPSHYNISLDPKGGLSADLSDATAASINDIRFAFQLQKFFEKSARSGSRYVEYLMNFFGVRSSDARLQRPEMLGAGRSLLFVSEVLQTSAAASQPTPQGHMAGHAISAQKSPSFVKSFEEHGIVMTLMSIMPKTQYQQGTPRMFSRETRFDYYLPTFANLGEQAVFNKEIYADHAQPLGVFGYQPRYEEYRHTPNTVHGMMKDTLDYWHFGRQFTSAPALNSTFLKCNPDMRVFAVQDEDPCYIQLTNIVTAIRPIPKKGIPGYVDHN